MNNTIIYNIMNSLSIDLIWITHPEKDLCILLNHTSGKRQKKPYVIYIYIYTYIYIIQMQILLFPKIQKTNYVFKNHFIITIHDCYLFVRSFVRSFVMTRVQISVIDCRKGIVNNLYLEKIYDPLTTQWINRN